MSRKTAFILAEHEFFHVYNRGVDRRKIFLHPGHFRMFETLLLDVLRDVPVELSAYVLMPNHFHLLLFQRKSGGISHLMSRVCNTYVKIFNAMQERNGHLFQGTYRIKMVDSDFSLLHVSRYIHCNPVRAGLAAAPSDWPYSDYRTATAAGPDEAIRNDAVKQLAGGGDGYRRFVEEYRGNERDGMKRYIF